MSRNRPVSHSRTNSAVAVAAFEILLRTAQTGRCSVRPAISRTLGVAAAASIAMADMAFDEGARLDRQDLVNYVADDLGGAIKRHRVRFDLPGDLTADAGGLGNDVARDNGTLA